MCATDYFDGFDYCNTHMEYFSKDAVECYSCRDGEEETGSYCDTHKDYCEQMYCAEEGKEGETVPDEDNNNGNDGYEGNTNNDYGDYGGYGGSGTSIGGNDGGQTLVLILPRLIRVQI